MFKRFLILSIFAFLISFIGIHFVKPASAENIISIVPRKDWAADDSIIANVKYNASIPKSIKILSFNTDDFVSKKSVKDYLQGFYFYNALSNGADLPFNYVVGWDGSVYEGVKGGYRISLDHLEPDTLLIMYVDGGYGITTSAKNSMLSLLSYLNSVTGVGRKDMISGGLVYDSKNKFSISSGDSNFNSNISNIVNTLKGTVQESTVPLSFSVNISSVKAEKAPDGDELITVNFTNTSSTILEGRIYAGSDSDSGLYIQDNWISKQRTSYTNLPLTDVNATTSLTFEINSKAKDGVYSLNLYTDNAKINSSEFSITIKNKTYSFNTSAPTPTPTPASQKVTVTNTPYGYLNVRESPSLSGKILGRINSGSSFTVLETSTTSGKWYKITYKDNLTGWIDAAYTK